MSVDGSASVEASVVNPSVAPFQHETGVDIQYGEKTWRPVQSVIDLVQNHLDANTTVYERRLLASVGITEYNPRDSQQQRAVTLLNRIKYSEPEETQTAYRDLQGVVDALPQPKVLHEQLEGIQYAIPRMRLKVKNGDESKFIEYSEANALSSEWEITGFRVEDEGTGFDSRLLGMMGASTKEESGSKRGGLGEGLKMSITHLTRSGAKIRLLSHNDDQLWLASPHVEGGTVSFKGKQRTETAPNQTGSLTDVDFSSQDFDPELRTEITRALDPRNGEGLGKYVLEFRGPEFIPLSNDSSELTSHGVPGGRVYVRGLLVEEADNLLFSYNLSEKWAIKGRDRKNAQQQLLTQNVKQTLETMQDQAQIAEVVDNLKVRNNFVEVKSIDGSLNLTDEQQEVWRLAVQGTFPFKPGDAVFASDVLTQEQQRVATERGFQVIRLPTGNVQAIDLIKKLYPDQIVTFKDLDAPSERVVESAIPISDQAMDLPVATKKPATEAILSDDIQGALADYKDTFTQIIMENALRQLARDEQPQYLAEGRFRSVKFASARTGMVFEGDSSFSYDPIENIMYVKDGINPADFQSIADLYVQLLKVPTGRSAFTVESQEIVTVMAGEAVIDVRPELLTEYQLDTNGHARQEKPVTYPHEQREKDERTIAYSKKLKDVQRPGITIDELVDGLVELNRLKTNNTLSGGFEGGNTVYYTDGAVYSFSEAVPLHRMDFSDKPTQRGPSPSPTRTSFTKTSVGVPKDDWSSGRPGNGVLFLDSLHMASSSNSGERAPDPNRKLFSPDDTQISLAMDDYAYLPYELQDGESMTFLFNHEGRESQIVLQRKGAKTITTRIIDGKTESTDGRLDKYVFERTGSTFDVYNTVLRIRSYEASNVTIKRNARGKMDQLQETNSGKEFIPTNITLDYGGEIWRDPRRILLDAIQNHIDAQGNRAPTISYTVLGEDGTIERVTKEALRVRDETWKIVGVEVSDDGTGYPTPYLTRLGTSTKGDQDRGKYGEGLKMLAAAAVRQGITVETSSRDWTARPTHHPQTVKDYETGREQSFDFLGYDMQWQDQPRTGSSTTFSLPSTDSPQGEIWQSWVDVLDPRNADQFGQRGLDRYVLPYDESRPSDGIVTVLPDRNGSIYEKGLLIPREATEHMLFGYNIDETIIDTRERNDFNQQLLDRYLADYFNNLTDTTVMRHILEMTKQQPETNFYEYKFVMRTDETNEMTKALWRETYFEVFGDDAILSLQPIHQETQRIDSRARKSYIGYKWDSLDDSWEESIAKAVAIEEHVPTLQTLPLDLTRFFYNQVYTSREYRAAMEGSEVEIPAEEKERLVALIRVTNQMMLTMLESLDSNTGSKDYLEKIVLPEDLARRKEKLRQVKVENVHIKPVSFPYSGMIEEVDDEPVIYLNQGIITKPAEVIAIQVHEASHYLSDQRDYVLNFQRFMMAWVLSRGLPALT